MLHHYGAIFSTTTTCACRIEKNTIFPSSRTLTIRFKTYYLRASSDPFSVHSLFLKESSNFS